MNIFFANVMHLLDLGGGYSTNGTHPFTCQPFIYGAHHLRVGGQDCVIQED